MSHEPSTLPDREDQLDEALLAYHKAVDAGQAPDPHQFIARYPDLAEELDAYFAAQRRLDPFIAPFRSEPAAPALTAVRFAGGCELGPEIGRGGMGVVYRARESDLDRDLAIKVLRPDRQGIPQYEQRFLEEEHILGQLQHPGIVPIHASGRLPDGRPFFTMKLVKGQTLAELLRDRQIPGADASGSLPRLLAIFEQVCQTMAYAHSRRVIHRDLKPANIMVGAFGEIQVMDWGLTKVLPSGGPASGEREPSDPAAPCLTDTVSEIRPAPADTPRLSTQTGDAMGTWAYMPPEQARGEVDRVDERCDVFSLGAILCEILTGQPPYAGPTRTDVAYQARKCKLADAHARLASCGADTELVELALKCLAHDREQRPRDATAVAQAVAVHLAALDDRARKAEVERAAAEAKARSERKARRLTVGLAAAVLLTVVAASGGWLWVAQDRSDRERQELTKQADAEQSANLALGKAAQLMDQAAKVDPETVEMAKQAVVLWRQASDLLDQAEGVLASGFGAEAAREKLAERRRDTEAGLRHAQAAAKLLAGLDKARALRSSPRGSDFDFESADRAYADAVAAYGLDVLGRKPKRVATAIKKERPAVRQALILALHDWGFICTNDKIRGSRLRQVAGLADDDGFWRRWRGAAVAGGDLSGLKRLAEEARGQALPAVSFELLAIALMRRGARAEAVALLRHARGQHPTEFWIYHQLGISLYDPRHPDPETLDEALGCFWAAVALRPGSAPAHNSLGVALADKGLAEEAIACYHKAIHIDPRDGTTHINLGIVLRDMGRLDEAIAEHNKAIDLDPKLALAHHSLGNALVDKGQVDKAIACYHKAIDINPKFASAYNGLGTALADKDQVDEAIAYYHKAIDIDPRYAAAHYNLGNALAGKGRLGEAITEYRHSIKFQPDHAETHCNLGHALRERGDFDKVLTALKRGHELGSKRKDWRYPSAQWVKECERLAGLEKKLPAILKGDARPTDNEERLLLAHMCLEYKKCYLAAVGFFTDAFATLRTLADDVHLPHRYNAACSAALAAAGQGQDAAKLDEKERARLRQQSLIWLRADLTAWGKLLDNEPEKASPTVLQMMQHWQQDPGLAGVRSDALAKLPKAEQEEWRKLWADVEALLKRAKEKK
jgi:serine/threonine-protein kinase